MYRTFRRWLAEGLFEQLPDELRALSRSHERRDPDPSAALGMVDEAKVTVPGVGAVHFDAGNGGARERLATSTASSCMWFGTAGNRNFLTWVVSELQPSLAGAPSRGLGVLAKRWIIECTNAWNDRPRRLNKDHDRSLAVSEGWIWLAEGRRLLLRVNTEMPHQAQFVLTH